MVMHHGLGLEYYFRRTCWVGGRICIIYMQEGSWSCIMGWVGGRICIIYMQEGSWLCIMGWVGGRICIIPHRDYESTMKVLGEQSLYRCSLSPGTNPNPTPNPPNVSP